jgi:hypothetical protein
MGRGGSSGTLVPRRIASVNEVAPTPDRVNVEIRGTAISKLPLGDLQNAAAVLRSGSQSNGRHQDRKFAKWRFAVRHVCHFCCQR